LRRPHPAQVTSSRRLLEQRLHRGRPLDVRPPGGRGRPQAEQVTGGLAAVQQAAQSGSAAFEFARGLTSPHCEQATALRHLQQLEHSVPWGSRLAGRRWLPQSRQVIFGLPRS
jgi:hypothetical protein